MRDVSGLLRTAGESRWHASGAVVVWCVVTAYHRSFVLLLNRSRTSYWTLPGGAVDADETPRACACRRLSGQAGLDMHNEQFHALPTSADAESDACAQMIDLVLVADIAIDRLVTRRTAEWTAVWVPVADLGMLPLDALQRGYLQMAT